MEASKKLKLIKKIGIPTAITFSFTDIILGILTISYIDLLVPSVLTSSATLIILIALYNSYKRIKARASDVEEFVKENKLVERIFDKNSIITSVLDVAIGLMLIYSTTVLFVIGVSKVVKLIAIGSKTGGKIIQLKKSQNLLRNVTFGGAVYVSIRDKKFMVEAKKMFKKILQVLNSNKISLLLSGTGIAAMADAILGSPVVNEILAFVGVQSAPLWLISVVYGGVLILTLAGIKWEKVEDFIERIRLRDEALKEKLLDEEAKRKLAENQQAELNRIKNELRNKKE